MMYNWASKASPTLASLGGFFYVCIYMSWYVHPVGRGSAVCTVQGKLQVACRVTKKVLPKVT